MLEFNRYVPADAKDGAPVFVLLHGRGADKDDLMGLQPHLPQNAILITPQAPFSGLIWGYGPGWAWYQFLGRNRPDPTTFERSQEELETLLRELPGLLPIKPGRIILGGFSQGATMATAYALRNPGQVSHVVNFSGFLADHPSVRATPETVQGMRFFWGHGTQDPQISFALGEEGRAALRAAGADLTARDYRMGHGIELTELQDMTAWLQEA